MPKGENPNSHKNLPQRGNPPFYWPKGVSGNPGGRSKSREITNQYKAILAAEIPESLRKRLNRQKKRFGITIEPGMTFGEILALRTVLRAIVIGDMNAVKEITARIEGTLPKNMNLEVSGAVSMLTPEVLNRRLESFLSGRNSQDQSEIRELPEHAEIIDVTPAHAESIE